MEPEESRALDRMHDFISLGSKISKKSEVLFQAASSALPDEFFWRGEDTSYEEDALRVATIKNFLESLKGLPEIPFTFRSEALEELIKNWHNLLETIPENGAFDNTTSTEIDVVEDVCRALMYCSSGSLKAVSYIILCALEIISYNDYDDNEILEENWDRILDNSGVLMPFNQLK